MVSVELDGTNIPCNTHVPALFEPGWSVYDILPTDSAGTGM